MKYVQGDVIIKKVDSIPINAKKQKHLILAEGEFSGHNHRIVSGQAELLLSNNVLFLKVISETALLKHQEHKPIEIPQGKYQIGIVREWDYEEEESRSVQD